MKVHAFLVVSCLALTMTAGQALAGGQQIAVDVGADGNSLLVRTYRCGRPSEIVVTGTAQGVVNGEPQSLTLKLTRTKEPGVFAVERQWPTAGRWVLTFTAQGGGFVNALVELQPGATLRIASQESTRTKFTREQVMATLERLSRS